MSGQHQRLDLPNYGTERLCVVIWCSKYVLRYGEFALQSNLIKSNNTSTEILFVVKIITLLQTNLSQLYFMLETKCVSVVERR